jgi:adenosylcobyric acid synthase
MSLNSFVTPDGLELGRAQAVQAEAAQIPCESDMNPVLLKPTNDKSSQVVLNGKPVGNQSAYEYFMANDRRQLFTAVKDAFDRLALKYSPIVMEGAGSISELNLKHRDITNLGMAAHAGAAVYLVADIDKGGVFGSVYGTIALLTPEERACMKGIIINKFRGDGRLFEDGKRMLEELTGLPVVGVLPYFRDIHIEQEDSVSLELKYKSAILQILTGWKKTTELTCITRTIHPKSVRLRLSLFREVRTLSAICSLSRTTVLRKLFIVRTEPERL